MDKNIEFLYELLKKEYGLYQKLQDRAIQKKEIIIANDIEKLTEIVQEDNEIISEIAELEEKRRDIINELNIDISLDNQMINYQKLFEKLPESWKEKYSLLREDLIKIIDELQEQNEQNKVLLEEAIKINDFNFNMMTRILEPNLETYNPKNNKNESKITHIVDRKG